MPGRPPQVAWRCSRNELSGKAGAVHYSILLSMGGRVGRGGVSRQARARGTPVLSDSRCR